MNPFFEHISDNTYRRSLLWGLLCQEYTKNGDVRYNPPDLIVSFKGHELTIKPEIAQLSSFLRSQSLYFRIVPIEK